SRPNTSRVERQHSRSYAQGMARCPQCRSLVPFTAALRAGGLAGVVCPTCNTDLEPRRWSNALSLAAGKGMSKWARDVMRSSGVGQPAALLAGMGLLLLIFFLVSWVAWRVFPTLRRRPPR